MAWKGFLLLFFTLHYTVNLILKIKKNHNTCIHYTALHYINNYMQKLKAIYMLLLFCSLLTDFPESCDTHCLITGFLKMYFTKEYSILPPGLNTSGQIHCFSWFLDSFCSDSGYSYRLYEYTNILSCKITHLSTDIQVNIIISLSLCA